MYIYIHMYTLARNRKESSGKGAHPRCTLCGVGVH